jgi:hypothetical protein
MKTTYYTKAEAKRKYKAVIITMADIRYELKARQFGINDMPEYTNEELTQLLASYAETAKNLRNN